MNKSLHKIIKFTFGSKIEFERKPFNKLEDKDIKYFQDILPKYSVIDDPNLLEAHNTCYLQMIQGRSKLLLCPQDTQQVSDILS